MNVKHILRWSLPSARPQYLTSMLVDGPVTTTNRKQAMVFGSKREAKMHPANLHPGAGFAPEPLKRTQRASA